MTYHKHRSMKPFVLLDDTSLNRQRIVLSKTPSLTYTCPEGEDYYHPISITYGTTWEFCPKHRRHPIHHHKL